VSVPDVDEYARAIASLLGSAAPADAPAEA
jgi:hypothetical protein